MVDRPGLGEVLNRCSMPVSNLTSMSSFASADAEAAGWPAQSALLPMTMVAPAAAEDPVPPDVAGVIELYATQLAKVAFPEIDAASLRRQADEVRVEARSVAKAREALDAALASFAARRVALGETAARAVAYARIYSQAHPDRAALATAIAALSETKPVAVAAASAAASGAGATGKRRGRPPRRSAELFDTGEQPPTSTEPADAASR